MEKAKRILVVDDEETLCDALAFNLEAEGYEVATAYSAEEALTHDLSGYDLILLDIMMGEISGTQLARIMKANPATASVPIIFCTAKDTEDDMIKGLDLGADDYIMKPYLAEGGACKNPHGASPHIGVCGGSTDGKRRGKLQGACVVKAKPYLSC